MLQVREWGSQPFKTTVQLYLYTFVPSRKQDSCMKVVELHSEDLEIVASVSENSEWIYPEQQVARLLVELFKEIPQVNSICAKFSDDEILVWTLLDSYDRDAREKVYGKELELCRLLRIHNFDFRVTSAELVPPDDLIAAGSREIYRRH